MEGAPSPPAPPQRDAAEPRPTEPAAAAAPDKLQRPPRPGPAGFGSFHSGDVEALIRQPPGEYSPPLLPFPPPPLPPGLSGRPFGVPARADFLIDFDRWTFVNHGAFGGALAVAIEDAERWRRRCEAQPLAFLDRELFPHMVRVIRDVAAFIGARPQDVVLLPNATTGLNVVISSVLRRLGPGDTVYSLDIGYGSVKKMLAVACADRGVTHVTGTVPLPVSSADDVVSAVEATLPAGAGLAVFDAVTSNSALTLPLGRLIALCRERGVPVLIDAAHAPGQLPLDVGALGADYLVANLHKWACGARGSALLWAAPGAQGGLKPLVVSHGSGAGFLSDFIWDGCRDYAPLLSLPAVLAWWRAAGPDRARAYMAGLLADAVRLLRARWGTGAIGPPDMTVAMACVELPAAAVAAARRLRWREEREQQQQREEEEAEQQQGREQAQGGQDLHAAAGPEAAAGTAGASRGNGGMEVGAGLGAEEEPPGPVSSEDGNWLQDSLHFDYAIEVPVKLLAGRLWVRVSAHVYNEIGDYEKLADAVLDIAARGG